MSITTVGPIHLRLQVEDDAFEAAAKAQQLAGRIGFARLECHLIATAVSEIAMNVIRYAGKGTVRIAGTTNNKGLSVLVEDKGPGIKNIWQALTDGYTTSKASLGVGMGAARRAMDFFDVRTRPGHGTRIRMEKFLPMAQGLVDIGVVSLPDDHYTVNGDGYIIRDFGGDKLLLAVIDGLGQGELAYRSTMLAKEVIESDPRLPLDRLLYKCDAAFKGKNTNFGASIGLLLLRPRTFHYAAVGDTFLKVLTGTSTQIPSQRGVIGPFRMPLVRVVKKTITHKNCILTLCTDGVKEHFSGSDLPLDTDVHSIAARILQRYRREFGDATVLVAKCNKSRQA